METTEQYNRYENVDEEKNALQDLLKKYLPWWPLFIVLVGLGFVGSWAYLKLATPIYQASATILVKDDDKTASTANLVEAMDMFGSKKVVENEIEVIKSRTLARGVVSKLHLYAPITVDGETKGSGYLHSPVLIEILNLDTIVPLDEGSFTYDPATKKVQLGKTITDLNKWMTYEGNTLRFIPNKYSTLQGTQKKEEYGFTIFNMKGSAATLLGNLELGNEKHSSVISLKYKDPIQRRAEDILDQLILAYNEAAISEKNRFAANTLAFVDERLRYVVGELDSVEQKMEKYKSSNNIVDISAQGQLFLENVGVNDQKLTELNVQVAVLDKVADYVKSKDKSGGIVPSTMGVADPVLSSLLANLYSLELEYGRRAATAGENNPVMLGIQEQINKIKPDILETINTQKRNLIAGTSAVNATSSRYNNVLSTLPKKERELLDISRQQAIKNSIYTYLLEKREETALAYSSTVPDSRVIDTAESGGAPVNPKPMIAWLAGFVLALVAGIAFVEIRGMLNRNVKDRSEIEAILPVPILGEIVFEKDSSTIIVGAGKRTLAAEQFRQLRTSLGYLGINNRHKKIMVSSSIPGEGKSFVCANMGVSLSLAGKKVVMIELDIRKPQLSKNFNLPREVGVTNYLIGDKEPEDIIKSVPGHENLFLISSGPLPPNPSELIMNGNLEKLLAYLEQHFDMILLDTSPVGLVTDGFIISAMCDATLYVVRHGHTPRAYLKKLREESRMRPLKNMAIVFNGIKSEGFGKYSYGSGYKYGYGYVEDSKTAKKKNKPEFDKLFDTRS